MPKAIGGTLAVVAATILGLPTWQFVALAIGVGLTVTGVPIFVLVLRIDRNVRAIVKDQEVRVDALGRKRPDRLKGV